MIVKNPEVSVDIPNITMVSVAISRRNSVRTKKIFNPLATKGSYDHIEEAGMVRMCRA